MLFYGSQTFWMWFYVLELKLSSDYCSNSVTVAYTARLNWRTVAARDLLSQAYDMCNIDLCLPTTHLAVTDRHLTTFWGRSLQLFLSHRRHSAPTPSVLTVRNVDSTIQNARVPTAAETVSWLMYWLPDSWQYLWFYSVCCCQQSNCLTMWKLAAAWMAYIPKFTEVWD